MPGIVMIAMVVAVGVLDLVAILALSLGKRGHGRAALLPSAAGIALIAPLVAVGVATHSSTRGLGAMATGVGPKAELVNQILLDSLYVLVAGLLCLLVGLAAFALLVLPTLWQRDQGASATRPAASFRRRAGLLALSAAVVVLVAAPFEYVRRTYCIADWVLTGPDTGASHAPPYMGWDKDDAAGTRSIAAVSERIANGMLLGQLGGIPVLIIVLGYAAAGAVLAWPIRASRGFAALSLCWLGLLTVLWALPLVPLSKEIQGLRHFVAQTANTPPAH